MSEEKAALYIPQDAICLANVSIPQIRLGIQGAPGEGKTWSGLTFPNPIVASLGKGLGAHIGRTDVYELPFYSSAYVKSLVSSKPGDPPNTRDALYKFVEKEAPKLSSNQTFVIDSGTEVEEAFERQIALEPVYSSDGSENKFADWRRKITYFAELFTMLNNLNCHVIWLCHEQLDRNSKGELNGKLKPLLTGQVGDKIVKNFTDWFRQHCLDKKPSDKISDESLRLWGFKTKSEYMAMQDSFPGINSIYAWQTEGDDLFSAKASSLVNAPRFIPARYESMLKYLRKISPAKQS